MLFELREESASVAAIDESMIECGADDDGRNLHGVAVAKCITGRAIPKAMIVLVPSGRIGVPADDLSFEHAASGNTVSILNTIMDRHISWTGGHDVRFRDRNEGNFQRKRSERRRPRVLTSGSQVR